jgi:hypothetical protein
MNTKRFTNRKILFFILAAATVIAALGISGAAWAQSAKAPAQFTFTSFDYPSAVTTQADAVNTSGRIMGFYTDSSGVYHGF